jgi:hypothetical protein
MADLSGILKKGESYEQKAANNACSGQVGFGAIYGHFSGFEFFLHLEPSLTPPTCR